MNEWMNEYLRRNPVSRRRRRKGNLVPGGITELPCHWETNTVTWSSRLGVGRKSDILALYKIIVAKCEEMKTGWKVWQSLPRKFMADKGLFCLWWWWSSSSSSSSSSTYYFIIYSATLSVTDYMAPNNWIILAAIGKEVKESSRRLFEDSILTFIWRDWGRSPTFTARIVDILAQIRTGDPLPLESTACIITTRGNLSLCVIT
jgi:hypothetical protein